ncbi:hypothetical protein [Planctomicrobium sp. SH664]
MTTRLNCVVSGWRRLLHLLLTAGQRGDAPQAQGLLNQGSPGATD